MLGHEELRRVRAIVTHDECSDGLASAILLRDALPDASVQFVQYGTSAYRELAAHDGMLFCDISPPADKAREFVAADAIVLDHHKTARDVVASFGHRGVFGDEATEPGVSGAVLALRHVWLPLCSRSPQRKFAERFAMLAGIRDTWQTSSHLWHEACVQHQALMFQPHDDWMRMRLDAIDRQWSERFAWAGQIALANDGDRIQRALATAYRFQAAGSRVIAFEGLSLSSDAAEACREDADLVIAFGLSVESGQQVLKLSIRSNGPLDVSALAKRFGGGGHSRAAGFQVNLGPETAHPFALVERLINEECAQHPSAREARTRARR